ncbi:MAG TPA: oligosaccharide flippase family protein [Gemmatimonadales bacterium]|nr:oligosaccharide flippase family protein [Gemmatimonadales bacterium]
MTLSPKILSRQLGVLGSGVALGLAIRLVQSAVVARLLGVAEFGQLAAVVVFVAIVSRINDLGLPGSVSYHFRREPGSLPTLLRVVGSNFVWCCAVAIVVASIAPRLPLPFGADVQHSMKFRLALAGYLAVSTPATILPGLLTAAGDYGSYVRLTNLDALAQAVLVIGVILVFGASYQPVIAALAVEQALIIGVYLWHVRRYRHRAPEVSLRARDAYGYGLRLQWGVIMKLLSNRADLLIVGALLPVTQVGLYSVALGLRDLGLLPQSVYAAPFMNLVIDRSRDDRPSDRIPVLTTLMLQIGLSIVMVLAAAAALPFLIPLVYGPAFGPAAGPSALLFASIVFLAPASLCWMTYNAKGRPHLTSAILTAGGVLGPLLTFVVVSQGYGLYGASGAALVTAALTFGLSIYFLLRLQGYHGSDYREAFRRARSMLVGLAEQLRSWMGRPSQRRV